MRNTGPARRCVLAFAAGYGIEQGVHILHSRVLRLVVVGRVGAAGARLAAPTPVPNLRHVLAVLRDVVLVIDEASRDRLLRVAARAPRCGTRSMTSSTRWKRSMSFNTTMSNGVVVVPSSL